MSSLKKRIDVLLAEKGIFPSRERAQAALMAGVVYVEGQKIDKAGTLIDEEAEIFVKEDNCPYVSRGGLKLSKALASFDLSLLDTVCMDIGASTGGFTDCMLQNGAQKVYAIDVGYGQLDWTLRNRSEVVNLEKVNIRYLPEDAIMEPIDFISIDVSFISLKLVFPVASKHLREGGALVALVKPQFEVGKGKVGKNGIVRDPDLHVEVIRQVMDYGEISGLKPFGLDFSPVKGAKGNIEYLLFLRKNLSPSDITDNQKEDIYLPVEELVASAHSSLGKDSHNV